MISDRYGHIAKRVKPKRLLIKDWGTQSYLTKEVIKLLTKSLTKATEAKSLNDFQRLFSKWRL